MTPTETLKKHIRAMRKLLSEVVALSDSLNGTRFCGRTPECERQYQLAKKLVERTKGI